MKTSFYLRVNKTGSVSVTKGRPGLRFNEVSVSCQLELPDSLFIKPTITAIIKVDQENAPNFTIDAETVNNVKNAVETATGLNIKFSIENNE